MLSALRTLGWLACVIYSTIPAFWLVIHSRAAYWRSRHRSPYRLLVPMWMLMWFTVAFITAPWRHAALYRSSWTWFPALAFFALGLWLYRASGTHFSAQQLAGIPELRSEHLEQHLVTAGIRAHVPTPSTSPISAKCWPGASEAASWSALRSLLSRWSPAPS